MNFDVHFWQEADGLFVARMVDFDIVVSGESKAQLVDELAHQINMEYALARHYGEEPFERCKRPPESVALDVAEEVGAWLRGER